MVRRLKLQLPRIHFLEQQLTQNSKSTQHFFIYYLSKAINLLNDKLKILFLRAFLALKNPLAEIEKTFKCDDYNILLQFLLLPISRFKSIIFLYDPNLVSLLVKVLVLLVSQKIKISAKTLSQSSGNFILFSISKIYLQNPLKNLIIKFNFNSITLK